MQPDGINVDNPFKYAGQYYDKETGLYYLRARYYDPGLMRFITEDTNRGDVKDPLSLNLYIYCKGNPIKYVDINGHNLSLATDTQGGGGGDLLSLMYLLSDMLNKMSVDPSVQYASQNIVNFTTAANMIKDKAGGESSNGNPNNNWDKNKSIEQIKEVLKQQLKDIDTNAWNKVSRNSVEDSLVEHFIKHGKEVNASDIAQYLRKAEGFMRNLRGAQKFNIDGYVEGVIRYVKNGRYIDIAPDGTIISFGIR